MTNSRATCRSGHRCQPVTQREAMHCQFAHAAITLAKLAELEGINPHTLAAMVNPDRDDQWIPTRRLTSLLDRTRDNDALLHFYARQVGGFFYLPPPISDNANASIVRAIGEHTKELSEAVTAIDVALRSGDGITVDELPAIDEQIDDLVPAALRLKAVVHRSALPVSGSSPTTKKGKARKS